MCSSKLKDSTNLPSWFGLLIVAAIIFLFGHTRLLAASTMSPAEEITKQAIPDSLNDEFGLFSSSANCSTLIYNQEAYTYWRIPNKYGRDYYNMRFTPICPPETLKTIGICTFKPTSSQWGQPDLEIFVWQDDGAGFPDETHIIYCDTIAWAELVFYPEWNIIDVSSNNIVLTTGQDIHIGWSTKQNDSADTLACLSDNGQIAEGRFSVDSAGTWRLVSEIYGADFNMLITAELCNGGNNDCDGDGYSNDVDNCIYIANPGQEDDDLDGIGNVCDPDWDNDGLANNIDNCPTNYNPSQEDTDTDGQGDICDPDDDNDDWPDENDNCPANYNPSQEDTDTDGQGDICDSDDDNDGLPDEGDNCPLVTNLGQEDSDSDGIGDVCDDCTDADGDGYGNPGYPANTCATDNCPDIYNPDQSDWDADGLGNVCDSTPYQLYAKAKVTPYIDEALIIKGKPFTLDIILNNAGGLAAHVAAMSFSLYSPDNSIVNITHRNVGGEGAYGNILTQNGYQPGGYWDMIRQIKLWGWDGLLPDTFSFVGAGNVGWPSGLGEKVYIQLALQINEEGTFCIDSIDHPNEAYDWFFEYPCDFSGPFCWTVVQCIDEDNDLCCDVEDNCDYDFNPNQSDIDNDGMGDVCDSDIDEDGIMNAVDNCPYSYNPGQEDINENDIGDVCDIDSIKLIVNNGQDQLGITDSSFVIRVFIKPTDTVVGASLGFSWGQGNCCWQMTSVTYGPEINLWEYHEYLPAADSQAGCIGAAAVDSTRYLLPYTEYLWAEFNFAHLQSGVEWPIGSFMIIDSCFIPPGGTFTTVHPSDEEITPLFAGNIVLFPANSDTDNVADLYDNCPEVYNPDQMDSDADGIGDACEQASCCNLPGDANNSGVVNIADITKLINFLYKNGTPPSCPDEGDTNGNKVTNLQDITYLINYLYKNGPVPRCP